jgi:Tfp pilus assembly protein PilV
MMNVPFFKQSYSSFQSGVGLIEIIIAVGIILVVFPAVTLLLLVSTKSVYDNIRNAEAAYFAEEGIEALRGMRNKSWSVAIVPLAVGTPYYPLISGNEWTLTATNPGLINSLYTRTVTLSAVYRDANDSIAASGTSDPESRKVNVSVTWASGGNSESVALETYITNFLKN